MDNLQCVSYHLIISTLVFGIGIYNIWSINALMDYARLVGIIMMQTRKFFHEYSHSEQTANVLSLESFVLYNN